MKRLLVFACGLALCGAAWADAAFSLSGRISLRQQDLAYHGSLSWQHTDLSDDILLLGPLGQGGGELHRDASGAVLLAPDGTRHEAATVDELAARLFGAYLPIAELPNWIRGIAPDAHLDEMQRPRRLVLPEWTVEWVRYDENGRPQLLTLESPDVGVRLRIDEWTEGAGLPATDVKVLP